MKNFIFFIFLFSISPSFKISAEEVHHSTVAPGEEDHWSIFNIFMPKSFIEYVKERFGRTFIWGEGVGRIMHVVMSVLVFIISLLFAFIARRKLEEKKKKSLLIPEEKFNILAFFEILQDTLLGIMEGLMGEKKAKKFLPLISSLALFILFSNLLGLIPGFLPPSDNLNTTFALGIVVFFTTHYYGVKTHGISYFKHFLGPIIKWYALPLMLILFIIELISHFVRPCSLAVRLMGNIFGDHAVVGIFLSFAIPFVPIPMMILGLFVAFVQTLVFCLLSISYIAMAVEEAEH